MEYFWGWNRASVINLVLSDSGGTLTSFAGEERGQELESAPINPQNSKNWARPQMQLPPAGGEEKGRDIVDVENNIETPSWPMCIDGIERVLSLTPLQNFPLNSFRPLKLQRTKELLKQFIKVLIKSYTGSL